MLWQCHKALGDMWSDFLSCPEQAIVGDDGWQVEWLQLPAVESFVHARHSCISKVVLDVVMRV